MLPLLAILFAILWTIHMFKIDIRALNATMNVCDLREEFFPFFTSMPGDLELVLNREKVEKLFKDLIKAEQEFAATHLYIDCEPNIAMLIRWKKTRLDESVNL
ncbi:MAG: hypothetical protein Q8Q90_01655 [bacterium]|nr:hypothetical protein [bacterium]